MPQHRENTISEVSQATSLAQTLVSTQIEDIIDARRSTKRTAASMDIDGADEKIYQDETFTGGRKRSKNFGGGDDQNPNHVEVLADSGVHEPTIITRDAHVHGNSDGLRREVPSSDVTVIPFSLIPAGSTGGGTPKRQGGLRSRNVVRESRPPRTRIKGHSRGSRSGDAKRTTTVATSGSVAKSWVSTAAEVGEKSERAAWKMIAEIGEGKGAGNGDDGPEQPQPGVSEMGPLKGLDRSAGPMQRHGSTGPELFQRLAVEEEEEEEEESLDMSFIWGSLPDDDSVSSF
jgi:hypothetical protein